MDLGSGVCLWLLSTIGILCHGVEVVICFIFKVGVVPLIEGSIGPFWFKLGEVHNIGGCLVPVFDIKASCPIIGVVSAVVCCFLAAKIADQVVLKCLN